MFYEEKIYFLINQTKLYGRLKYTINWYFWTKVLQHLKKLTVEFTAKNKAMEIFFEKIVKIYIILVSFYRYKENTNGIKIYNKKKCFIILHFYKKK